MTYQVLSNRKICSLAKRQQAMACGKIDKAPLPAHSGRHEGTCTGHGPVPSHTPNSRRQCTHSYILQLLLTESSPAKTPPGPRLVASGSISLTKLACDPAVPDLCACNKPRRVKFQ